jgi:hypothetical protein
VTWFQKKLSPLRLDLLEGNEVSGCQPCRIMESHGKPSGRQKQLLKTGIRDPFDKTVVSSPWRHEFKHSMDHHGDTELLPQDWQIDLGNYCNSACVFCTPHSSSRLAREHLQLGIINSMPPPAWCDDDTLLSQFVDMLSQTPNLAYLHFIGGETMITPAFQRILQALIDSDLSHKVTIGFTTNLTVWDDDLITQLERFHQVNVGVSIECLHDLNDYLRWPSHINDVRALLERWRLVSQSHGWLMQIRITPTLFSILHLDTVYRYALDNSIAVESCDFLNEPAMMRISVLPQDLRRMAQDRLSTLVESTSTQPQILNTRHPDWVRSQIHQDCQSYIKYLESAPDESHRVRDLVHYIKLLESRRGNRILDYLPEYEQFLTTAGY